VYSVERAGRRDGGAKEGAEEPSGENAPLAAYTRMAAGRSGDMGRGEE
jgi:hypothetical protein